VVEVATGKVRKRDIVEGGAKSWGYSRWWR